MYNVTAAQLLDLLAQSQEGPPSRNEYYFNAYRIAMEFDIFIDPNQLIGLTETEGVVKVVYSTSNGGIKFIPIAEFCDGHHHEVRLFAQDAAELLGKDYKQYQEEFFNVQ